METKPPAEIATEIATLLKSEKSKTWIKGSMCRVYLRKGHLDILADGSVETKNLTGLAFSQGIAMQLRAAGYNVPERAAIGFSGTVKI